MKKASATKSYFTLDDDITLTSLVNQYGERDWDIICKLMKNKNRRQCKDRWRNYLDPSLNKTPFTDDENDLIRIKVAELGFKWKEISKCFINRTEAMVRNQFQSLSKRNTKETNVNKRISEFSFDFLFPFDESIFEQIKWIEENFD
jgi:hypothetical protein